MDEPPSERRDLLSFPILPPGEPVAPTLAETIAVRLLGRVLRPQQAAEWLDRPRYSARALLRAVGAAYEIALDDADRASQRRD